ncbi:TMEM165/GDT1 family protein [Sphingorhabdus sp.]|uniref:TMEM165/GDT1 family protein n=1 Tax=Sphingorhabdus sp. TaxID=1902408 RepID=UPI0035AE33B0
MEAFLTSTAIVAFAEIGDKTMLLAILLATRFRQPLPIILGILAATLLNHALAAFAGQQVAGLLDAPWFRWAVALGFVAMALWTLVPDKIDDDAGEVSHKGSVFLTTTIAFFLVEMGDKTQIATVALGAQYQSVLTVAAGTTLGMMIANVPAVYLGEELVKRVPLNVMRWIAAGLFLALGVWQIWGLAV